MNTIARNAAMGQPKRVPEENPVRPLTRLPDVTCKQCGGHTFERLPRYGFWQETVLPFFNRYPWRCVACATVTYQSQRAVRNLRRG